MTICITCFTLKYALTSSGQNLIVTMLSNIDDEVHSSYIEADQCSYEETAFIISNKDDPTLPSLVFRTWFFGFLFTIGMAILTTCNSFQPRLFTVPISLIFVFAYLMARVLSIILPKKRVRMWRGWSFSLNPGRFTIKENTIVIIMASSRSVISQRYKDKNFIYLVEFSHGIFCIH